MAMNITGKASVDPLLTDDPFALLVGMLLDQQVPMETAFAGPAKIRDRLGSVHPGTTAGTDSEQLLAAFRESPAVHRFLSSTAACVQSLAAIVRDEWVGDVVAVTPLVLRAVRDSGREPPWRQKCARGLTAA